MMVSRKLKEMRSMGGVVLLGLKNRLPNLLALYKLPLLAVVLLEEAYIWIPTFTFDSGQFFYSNRRSYLHFFLGYIIP